MYTIWCWIEISSYLVIPLYLLYRLYPRFATEGDVITSVDFHPFTGGYTYLRLFVMSRWWYLRPFRSSIRSLRDRRQNLRPFRSNIHFLRARTLRNDLHSVLDRNSFFRMHDTALVIVGSVIDIGIVYHQRIVRQYNNSLSFLIHEIVVFLPGDREIVWNIFRIFFINMVIWFPDLAYYLREIKKEIIAEESRHSLHGPAFFTRQCRYIVLPFLIRILSGFDMICGSSIALAVSSSTALAVSFTSSTSSSVSSLLSSSMYSDSVSSSV